MMENGTLPARRRWRSGRGLSWAAALLLVPLSTAAPPAAPWPGNAGGVAPEAPPGTLSEYRIKGAFLYKFVAYTTWPSSAFEGDEDPIVLALLGGHPHAGDVEEVLRGKTVGDRVLVVRHAASLEECAGAHVVYSMGENELLEEELIERHRQVPSLLLSDAESFAERGGTMCFFLADGKLRFAINKRRAEKSKLKISSELLKLAKIVGGDK